ncbi:MAG: hypothetical protein AB1512_00050 [Thermodesulfobacteriota bacterium]
MKKRRIIKNKSRIPGVPVGDQVATSIGTKKKVCFNINGRWFFRMVDPDWRAPGRPQKGRGQKSEVRGQRKEAQPRRAETEARKEKKGEGPKGGEKE